jgi:hypothetical protein
MQLCTIIVAAAAWRRRLGKLSALLVRTTTVSAAGALVPLGACNVGPRFIGRRFKPQGLPGASAHRFPAARLCRNFGKHMFNCVFTRGGGVMLRKLFLGVLLLTAAFSARAIDYTDVYYNPAESGWGFFVVQSNTFQFLAFFIYGSDGQPTWYTAQLTDDGTGTYTGAVYATTGTYFPQPWNPAQLTVSAVGTATFQPTDIYHATFTYTINGVGTVMKTVQRQTLMSYVLSGNYSGSMSGSISGCSNPAGNDPAFRGRYVLTVTQVGDQSATVTFTFVDNNHNGLVCTVSGPLTHLGRLYQMPGMLACTGPGQDGVARPATINSFHPTGQGIEGKLTGSASNGCAASLHFSAVLNVDN